MYSSKHQWGFWAGRSNDFDFLRIALSWKDYRTAKVVLVVLGMKMVVEFPMKSFKLFR